MKKILIDAFKSDELKQHLEDVIAVDDKCDVGKLSDVLILCEAQYVLNKFIGAGGFEQRDDWLGNNGDDLQVWARFNVAQLRRFIKKYAAKVMA